MHLVRSASLGSYEQVARDANLDPFRMLREAGIHHSALRDPDLMIDADAVGRLLERSARLSGMADFGLRMAEHGRLSNLGPVALVMREEPTVRQALECLVRYMRLHNEGLQARLVDDGALTIIHVDLIMATTVPARQGIELSVGVLARILSLFLGKSWRADCVCFSHDRPADLARHHRLFGPHVEFRHDFNGIVCRSGDLETAISTADPAMARIVRRQLDDLLAGTSDTTLGKVRKLVVFLLPLGQCTAERVAGGLGVDRRTVARHLAGEGQTFSSILDAVRGELAQRYLQGSDRPLSDVAELLGFSELSSFSRWFSRRFGCSASIWKARATSAAAKDWVI